MRVPLLLVDQAVFSGTSFMVTVLLARVLPVDQFGIFAGSILVLYLASSLISAFVVQPLQVALASVEHPTDYLAFTFWFQIALMSALMVLTAAILSVPMDVFAPYVSLMGPILGLSGGFMLHDYFRKRLLAENQIVTALGQDLLLMGAQLGLLAYASTLDALSLATIVSMLGWGYVPALAFAIGSTRPDFRQTHRWMGFAAMHLEQGKWLFYTALVQWWAANLFVVVTGFLLGTAALGALRLVQSAFGVLNVLFQTFENYVLPQTAERLTRSADEAKVYIRHIGRMALPVVGLSLFVLFLFSDTVMVFVGGEAFREYGYLVKGVSVLYMIIFAGYPIRIAIRALAMNKIFFKGYVLTFLFGLSSSYLFITHFHLAGAIAGYITSQLILLMYWNHQLHKAGFQLWKSSTSF